MKTDFTAKKTLQDLEEKLTPHERTSLKEESPSGQAVISLSTFLPPWSSRSFSNVRSPEKAEGRQWEGNSEMSSVAEGRHFHL